MAFKLFSDVRETSLTGGTGNQVLAGALDGSYFPFSARYSDGHQAFVCLKQGTARELTLMTYNASANSISRAATPYKSTNGGALVPFTAGQAVDIFVTNIAPQDLDAAGLALLRQSMGLSFYDEPVALTSSQQSLARSNIGIRGKNLIINGRFKIDQMNSGIAYVIVSNSYGPDQWRGLIESGTITIAAQAGNVAQTNGYFLSATANLKAGLFQPIEAANTRGLRGATVTLSAVLAVADLRLGNMKMGILQWAGSADAVSGSPISSWGADGVTPTLATNWSFVNAPANLNVTTGAALYSVTGTVGGAMNNLAVLIWNDDKNYNANDSVIITDVQLEVGSVATGYEGLSYADEMLACQRHLWVSNPAAAKGASTGALSGVAILSSVLAISARFTVPMRAAPSLTLWQNGSQNKFRNSTAGGQVSASIQSIPSNMGGLLLYYDNAAIFTVGGGYDFDIIADARL